MGPWTVDVRERSSSSREEQEVSEKKGEEGGDDDDEEEEEEGGVHEGPETGSTPIITASRLINTHLRMRACFKTRFMQR